MAHKSTAVLALLVLTTGLSLGSTSRNRRALLSIAASATTGSRTGLRMPPTCAWTRTSRTGEKMVAEFRFGNATAINRNNGAGTRTRIVNEGGLCLDAASDDVGAEVRVRRCNSQPRQQWREEGGALINGTGCAWMCTRRIYRKMAVECRCGLVSRTHPRSNGSGGRLCLPTCESKPNVCHWLAATANTR